MKFLMSSDIHCSDKPRDLYRFDIFPWLLEQQKRYKPDAVLLLGDLCEEKDHHSAFLVNKLVRGLLLLKPPVYLLKGNHDFIDLNLPYFNFLNEFDGLHFISEPALIEKFKIVMIPHQPSQEKFDEMCQIIPKGWGVLCHQTFDGVIAENNSRLTGFSTLLMNQKQPRWVYSGDIHKPQQVGPVTYVGAPTHIRFGDDYTPRVLLIEE